jgi:phenylacetic acid degradation operon negative regulatory protein
VTRDNRTAVSQEPRPGALVVCLLGDLDRSGGRELRLKALVSLGEQLGISGPTMRVTLARLRERGWFDVRREGRESVYRLTPACLSALDHGRRRIFRDPVGPWQGEWSMVIYTVPEADRQARDEVRKQLSWLGFGPLAPATWVCPQPRLDDVANATAGLASARLMLLTTRTSGLAADRAMAGRCWDLDALGADYGRFVTRIRTRLAYWQRGRLDEREALVERIRLLDAYRGFPERDPQLPLELQPAGWAGDEAFTLFDRAHRLLADMSGNYYQHLAAA